MPGQSNMSVGAMTSATVNQALSPEPRLSKPRCNSSQKKAFRQVRGANVQTYQTLGQAIVGSLTPDAQGNILGEELKYAALCSLCHAVNPQSKTYVEKTFHEAICLEASPLAFDNIALDVLKKAVRDAFLSQSEGDFIQQHLLALDIPDADTFRMPSSPTEPLSQELRFIELRFEASLKAHC